MRVQAGKGPLGRVLSVVSVPPILLSLQEHNGETGTRLQLWPPPAVHKAASSPPPYTLNEKRTLPRILFGDFLISPPSPSVTLRERIPATKGSVTWQLSQKAFMPVTQRGAGIYFPCPPSSFHPRGPHKTHPGAYKKSTVFAFSAASRFPSYANNFPQTRKRELPVLLSIVRAKGAVCCTPLHNSHIYMLTLHYGGKYHLFPQR